MATDIRDTSAEATGADPFALGWRYVPRTKPDGKIEYERIPLTHRDLLFPEEDDFVVTNENHAWNCLYLRAALEAATADRPQIKVFSDHRIDFEVAGLQPLGPDLAVLDGVPADWDPLRGTFPARSSGAKPLLVVEVVSPSTRDGDLDDKVLLYQRAGVPVYVIADARTRDETSFLAVVGYRLEGKRYVRAEPDAAGVLWVPEVGVGFQPDGLRLYVLDRDGQRIPEPRELNRRVRELTASLEASEQRAKNEKRRADREKKRAEQEKQRAEQEKSRADAEAARVKELEAELRRLRGE